MSVLEEIKLNLNDDKLYNIILPRLQHQIDNPDPKYGILSPMYSLMPCFFDYFDTEELTEEQMKFADATINVVDNAFGAGWHDLAKKLSYERDQRTEEMIKDIRNLSYVLKVII